MKIKQTIQTLVTVLVMGLSPLTLAAQAKGGLKKEMHAFLQQRGLKLQRQKSVSNNTGSTSPVYGSVENIAGEADISFRGRNLHLGEVSLTEVSEAGTDTNVIRFEQDNRRDASILQFHLPKLESYKAGQSFSLAGGNNDPSSNTAIIRFAYGKQINAKTAILYVTGDLSKANGNLSFVSESADKINAVFNANLQIYKIRYNLRNGRRKILSKANYKIANGRFSIPRAL